jgi:hypothetical protein
MSQLIEPGHALLYMKVGTHAQETLEDIIRRKTREIEEAGHAFWGYGGSTCHPKTVVQPFAHAYTKSGGVIYLCMEPMESSHFADPIRADEFSVDGFTWEDVPPAIAALGSRYALVIGNLRREEFDLPLSKTIVALGNSRGVRGSSYIRGRVDKASLEVVAEPPVEGDVRSVRIGLVAELQEPYAVFLRNRQAR